ncbi:MAG: type II secretion system protein [Phycisphaerales bacterium]
MEAFAVPRGRLGFTLIETLVTVAVMATLIGILLPALSGVREAGRSVICESALRGIAYDFVMFADPQIGGPRGDDPQKYGRNHFSLETFIESQYGLDEFWQHGSDSLVTRPRSSSDPLRCPDVRGELKMRRNVPCHEGALTPSASVSFGFNSRLLYAEVTLPNGQPRIREAQLSVAVLSEPSVPLVMDIDGQIAASRGLDPSFCAPSLDSLGPYADDHYWFPSHRHNGNCHAALIDGSVHAKRDLIAQTSWAWDYQPIH